MLPRASVALFVFWVTAAVATPIVQESIEWQSLSKRTNTNSKSGISPREESPLSDAEAQAEVNKVYWDLLEFRYDPEWMRHVYKGDADTVTWAEHEELARTSAYLSHGSRCEPEPPFVVDEPENLEELKRLRQSRGVPPKESPSFRELQDQHERDVAEQTRRNSGNGKGGVAEPPIEDPDSNNFQLIDPAQLGFNQVLKGGATAATLGAGVLGTLGIINRPLAQQST